MPGTDVVVYDPARVEREERFVRRNFWRKLRANLHRIPFLEELLAAYFCATDPTTPFKVKAILIGALVYFVMPFDALPDWLLLAGFTDDAAVLAGAVQAVRTNMTPAHWSRARAALRAEQAAAGGGALDGEILAPDDASSTRG
ncbi:YkvA family protein [Azospirillum doebereinerae]|uniref:DUF1232 domain-containing protein n=1 Tax=Azospirillum doebereinerae TaxID=92933 RepID=A0A433IZH4_9PROT|nr:YkvA family protein [Azospirillum doebereinerae]MCG5242707.1 DUF1232 domain-containing protein [Azospirillum doebereinerae]RUQ60717.1 DUF1232 domain-containing protein [Azospirillum doebereinerae]